MHQPSVRHLVPVLALAAMGGVLAGPMAARAQIPGDPVNMVSGRGWPGGDPFLQRQNEPSIAVSSANPEHLLAGANDYRGVDLALSGTVKMAGDAWLGVFKSFDGGLTWKSYLMPGYPLDPNFAPNELSDCRPRGSSTPMPCTSGADPVVRAAPDGLFYFSGIVFKRGTNYGKVVLTRWLDSNSKENGDPVVGADTVRFLDSVTIDVGDSITFADKPWLAVDVPRAGAATCAATGKPTGNVYMSWSRIVNDTDSDIFFSRSSDCGVTWSPPVQLNVSSAHAAQGSVLSVDPVTGDVYVAWRRFKNGNNTDNIVVVRSFSAGARWTKEKQLNPVSAYDQPSTGSMFRTEAFPTMAISVDPTGTRSWVHVAWAERYGAYGDSRILMTTASVAPPPPSKNEADDDLSGWSKPVPVDDGALVDAAGNGYGRGHQFMPQLTFSQGRLMLVYYDSRLDHVRKYYTPRIPFAPDAAGSFYSETWGPVGELLTNPALVFGANLDEQPLIDAYNADTDPNRYQSGRHRRHTVDVRVARALPGPAPTFTSVQVSRMPFGEPADLAFGAQADVYGPGGVLGRLDLTGLDAGGTPTVKVLQQLGVNPPNLPMFKQGTVPFIGDYIDIQGPVFVRRSGGWAFLTDYVPNPVFHAIWTSNQDVRPPADGDWTRYTPVRLVNADGSPVTQSRFDPTQAVAVCEPGFEATRDQNIYTSRITEGIVVSSPQNAKPLSATVTRAFVVLVQNTTGVRKAVRFTVDPPAGVNASFRNDGVALRSFDVWVPPRSHVYRSVFVSLTSGSGNPSATVEVKVAEVNPSSPASCIDGTPPVPCDLLANGGGGSVLLNPPGSDPSLTQPDGGAGNVNTLELYTANIGSANIGSANIGSANIGSANIGSFNITNANIGSANIGSANIGSSGISAAHISNASVANIGSANIGSANIGSANIGSANFADANIGSANIGSANIGSANIGSAAISDASYSVTNVGNTTTSYHVVLVGSSAGAPLQLILSKQYATLTAANCTLAERPANRVLLSIDDPYVIADPTAVADPNIPDPSVRNATFAIAPGETAQITIRGPLDEIAMRQLASQLRPVVVPHAGGVILDPTTVLPQPRVGETYAGTIRALGGKGTLTWTVTGSLPPGMTYAPSADTQSLLLGGVPSAVTPPTAFTVKVGDDRGDVSQSFTLSVIQGRPVLNLVPAPTAPVHGQAVTLGVTVAPQAAGGSVPTGTVEIRDNGTTLASGALSGGSFSAPPAALSTGAHAFTVAYSGNADYAPATSSPVAVTVAPAATATALVSTTGPSVYGQPVALRATVAAVAPGAGTPTGTVTFSAGGVPLSGGTVALLDGAATFTASGPLAPGSTSFTAAYGGDGDFTASTSSALAQVVTAAATTTTIDSAPNASRYGEDVYVTAAVAVTAPGAGTPTGTVTFRDGSTTLGTAPVGATFVARGLTGGTHSLTATYATDGNFLGSGSAVRTQTVQAVTSTLGVQQAGPASFGQLVGVVATVGPSFPGVPGAGGTVTLLEGSLTLGSIALSGGTGGVSLALPGGTHYLGASYGGDGNFAPATLSAPIAIVVSPATDVAAMTSSLNASTYGQAVTFSMQVLTSASAPVTEGSVSFYDGTLLLNASPVPLDATGIASYTVASLAAGNHAISGRYLGTANYQPITATLPGISAGTTGQQVNRAATAAALATSANPVAYGAPVTFTCTVTAASAAPTGPVQFAVGGVSVASASLDGTGKATWATTTLPGGTSYVSCVYPSTSSPNFLASASNAIAEVVNNVSTTTTLTSSPSAPLDDKPFTLTATVTAVNGGTATGTVTFRDGTTVLGTAALSAGKATWTIASTPQGSHTYTASYGGDATYAGSTGTLVLTVLEDYSCDAYDKPLAKGGDVSAPTNSGNVKAGSTVDVRFRFPKPTGTYVTRTSAIQSVVSVYNSACDGKPPAGAPSLQLFSPTTGTVSGSTLKYDATTGYFDLGWVTTGVTKGCWVVVLTCDNGNPKKATFIKLQ